MSHRLQLIGQSSQAFCGPPEGRFGISPRHRLDQRFEIAHERGIPVGDLLPSSSRTPDPPVRRRTEGRTFRQLFQSGMNGASRHPGRLGDGRDASMAQNLGFGGTDNPAQPFIQCPRQQVESVSDQILLHGGKYSKIHY